PPSHPLFPYTTLFRSLPVNSVCHREAAARNDLHGPGRVEVSTGAHRVGLLVRLQCELLDENVKDRELVDPQLVEETIEFRESVRSEERRVGKECRDGR